MDVLYLVCVTFLLNRWIDAVDPNESSMFEIGTLTFAVLAHLVAVGCIIIYNMAEVWLMIAGRL